MTPIQCYFKVPAAPIKGLHSLWLKARVEAALQADLEPAPLPSAGLTRLSVAMPPAMLARVRDLAQEWGVSVGRMVGMLSEALDREQLGQARPAAAAAAGGLQADAGGGAIAGAGPDRPEQVKLLAAAAPLLDAGRIVLIEAGTGVGKSRLAGRLAQRALAGPRARRGCVVVSTPTISQIVHLAAEFKILRDGPTGAGLPPPALLLGRANFIDLDAALCFAIENGVEAAARWIDAGAPAGLTDSTRKLAEFIPGICGLADDWEQLTCDEPSMIGMTKEDFALTEKSGVISLQAYERVREEALSMPLVLCTHAMLASDCIAKKREQGGVLADIDLLVLDEAHSFEQELSNIASQSVSLRELQRILRREQWTQLRAGKLAEQALKDVAEVITKIERLPYGTSESIRLPSALESNPRIAAAWPPCAAALVVLSESLKALSAKLGAAKDVSGWRNAQRRIQDGSRAIDFILLGTHDVEVTYSKEKRWASMTVGPRSVKHYLQHLWERCGSAALMSATLYVPTALGDTSFYISKILSLPEERTSQTVAEHPAWITSSPKLMLPDVNSLRRLSPPSGEEITLGSLTQWLTEVSLVVKQVAGDAAGGTLVLMSAYDRLNILAKLLAPDLKDRLVVQQRGRGVAAAQNQFLAMAARGMRPIWLAAGGAWTGLDLRDKDVPDDRVEQDLLLTDLVIPNVPMGLNRGTTHAARRDRFMPIEGMSTGLMFRQGLGRLIRRQGLQRRRIWMLDSRLLVRKATASGGMFSPCLMMLDKFPRRERFALPAASKFEAIA